MSEYDEITPPDLTPLGELKRYPRSLRSPLPPLPCPEVEDEEIDKLLLYLHPTETSRKRLPQTQYGRRLIVATYMRLISLARRR